MADNKQRDPSWQLTRQILVEPWKWKPQQVEAATNLAAEEGFRLVPHRNADGKVFWTLEDARAEHDARYQYAPSVLDPHGDPEMPTAEQAEAIEAWKQDMAKDLERAEQMEQIRDLIGQRESEHGDYAQQFSMCAALWSSYLQVEIRPYDVAILNALQKISRIENGDSSYPDHWDDLIGYALIGREIAGKRSGV